MEGSLITEVPRRTPLRVELVRDRLVVHCQKRHRNEHHRSRWLILAVGLAACFAAGAAAATGFGWFSDVAPTPVSARTTVATGDDWTLVSWDSSRGLCLQLELSKGGGATSCGLSVAAGDDLAAAVSYADATTGANFLFGLVDPRTRSATAVLADKRRAPVDVFADRQGHRYFLVGLSPSQSVSRLDLRATNDTQLGSWQVPNVSGRLVH